MAKKITHVKKPTYQERRDFKDLAPYCRRELERLYAENPRRDVYTIFINCIWRSNEYFFHNYKFKRVKSIISQLMIEDEKKENKVIAKTFDKLLKQVGVIQTELALTV